MEPKLLRVSVWRKDNPASADPPDFYKEWQVDGSVPSFQREGQLRWVIRIARILWIKDWTITITGKVRVEVG